MQLEGVLAGLSATVPTMHPALGVDGEALRKAEAGPDADGQHSRLPDAPHGKRGAALGQAAGSEPGSALQGSYQADDGSNSQWAAGLEAGVPIHVSLTIDAA